MAGEDSALLRELLDLLSNSLKAPRVVTVSALAAIAEASLG